MHNTKSNKLYNHIISDINIYNAIYSMESYIFEKGLLEETDVKLYLSLTDKFDFNEITPFIQKCQELLRGILLDPTHLFDVRVYFKFKKLNDNDKIDYRPIHTANLTTQVCMVAILNAIMFEDTCTKNNDTINKRKLSNLSNLIPSNFYGNIPSIKAESIFEPWHVKYKEYSDSILEKYTKYSENKKYNYEISLDFENFFPSIDPKHIYSYIIDKLSCNYSDEDFNILKIAVSKLLYCNLTNINYCTLIDYYYESELNITKKYYTKGIPQGLPQGYLFGNICMIELSKLISNVFEGDALYYVDDSVIYTNNGDDFESKINTINSEINNIKWSHRLVDIKLDNNVIDFHSELNYKINLHKNNKSNILKLDEAQWGLHKLRLLAGESYNINSALFLSLDEIEDKTTKCKLEEIISLIDKELTYIKECEECSSEASSNSDQNIKYIHSYKKTLTRYRKFCTFRLKIISKRIDNNSTGSAIDQFCNKYPIIDKKHFFEQYDKEIFEAELSLLIKNSTNDSFAEIKDRVNNIEQSITEITNSGYMYFEKAVDGQLSFEKSYTIHNKSLYAWAKTKYKNIHKQSVKHTISDLQNELNNKFDDLSLFNDAKYARYIYDISEEYQRRLLNVIFSSIINVEYSESSILQKKDNRALRYFELRLLTWLRNKRFRSNDFHFFAKSILHEAYNDINIDSIDYTINEILYILIAKVRDPKKIDDIILVHKLIKGLWENGSKFLHFYTLHNEEHSIALIKNVVTLINTISYLNIKEQDYYVLFLACYLHDISMVIHPDLNNFCVDSDSSDIIYTQFVGEISKCNQSIYSEQKSRIKHLLIDYFKKIDNYFESEIRNNHTKNSTKFIKEKSRTKYLDFIDNSILQLVANIGESHGYDATEVYGRKSNAKTEFSSIKYMMILIRFADLLDLAKNRVSEYILKENIHNMSSTSQFHWISHYITDKCELNAEYKIRDNNDTGYQLQKGAIKETIIFDLFINTEQLVSTKNGCNCDKYIECNHNLEDKKITIDIPSKPKNNSKICRIANCSLLCKWITMKHEYLFNEIHELVNYLNTINNDVFSTEIIVNINYKDKQTLDTRLLDCVITYLN